MSKRTTFTTISPLPPGITREVVVEFLHNHLEMIDLNPLVKERHCIKPPSHATADELQCTWYSLTDRISYLPGGLANGDVTYTCAFHDLPNGIQTHCYAPAGLNIREKWTLNGSLPGEPVEPVELGTGAPVTGLYIREDVDMRCSILMAGFVKKTLKKSHASLIERLKIKAQMASTAETHARVASGPVPLSPSASVRSDLGQSWTQSSSVSSASPSVKAFMPQLHYRHYTPPQIPPAYQSTPSTAPSSVCSTPQKQYTSTPPLVSAFNHSMRQHQCRTERKPLPSPPQPQHHSRPPAYARYEHEPSPPPQHLPQPPKYGHLSRPEQSPLVPEPLRLRRDSACSVGSRTSSAPHNGRNTAAAVHAMPSVRYRASHPDYPQMNPYAEDDRQVADRDTSVPGVGAVAGDVRRGPAIRGEATLMGPFIAELEG